MRARRLASHDVPCVLAEHVADSGCAATGGRQRRVSICLRKDRERVLAARSRTVLQATTTRSKPEATPGKATAQKMCAGLCERGRVLLSI